MAAKKAETDRRLGKRRSAGTGAARADAAAQPRALRAHPAMRGRGDGGERERSVPDERHRRADRRRLRLALSVFPGQDGDHRHAGRALQCHGARLRRARNLGDGEELRRTCIRRSAASSTATIRCSSTSRSCATSGRRPRPTARCRSSMRRMAPISRACCPTRCGASRRVPPNRRSRGLFATDDDTDRRRRAPRDRTACERRKAHPCDLQTPAAKGSGVVGLIDPVGFAPVPARS